MSSKKNCGCGQDPCKTYGAETFEGENYRTDNCIQCGKFNEYECDECDLSLCEDCALTPDEIPVFSDDNAYVSETRDELNRKYEDLCKGCVAELAEYYKDDSYNAETLDEEETWKNRENMSYFFVIEEDERGISRHKPYRTKEDAIKAGEKPDEIYEYRGVNSLSKEEREAQKKDNHEWYDREKQGEFFEDFWWKNEMSRYGNSDYERLHHSLYDSSTENDEKDGFFAKTILPSNPSGFEQETNQAYAQQLGISERLGALLNSSRSFGMYISQRAHPDTVKKYRQKILDGFDSYKPQSEKEKKIVEIVRENMATRGVKGPSPSYWSSSQGMLRKPQLHYAYDDYYDNPIPFMGYELTDEEKKIIGDVKSADDGIPRFQNKLHAWATTMFSDVKLLIEDLENGAVYDLDDCRERLEKIRDDTSHLGAEYHRDSKGRFAEKPLLTGSVIGGLALGLMYFMGRK